MTAVVLENEASRRQRSFRLQVLQIAGLRVDLAISSERDPFSHSGAAARLAERLVAARLWCDPHLVRVAALPPPATSAIEKQAGERPE